MASIERVLASADGDADEPARFGRLRLVPAPTGGSQTLAPDPELKRLIDEMRRRAASKRGGGADAGGKDAA